MTDSILRSYYNVSSSMFVPFAVTAPSGANRLLTGETDGFAIDATTENGTVAVIDTGTPANNKSNVALNSSNLVQSGTSAKHVIWNDSTLHTVASGLVAQQYDVAALKFGILVEVAATNTHEQSESFTNAFAASVGGLTITDNDAGTAAPDGTTTADKLTESTNNEVHTAHNAGGGIVNNPGSAQVTTFSLFMKSGTQQYVLVRFGDAAGPTTFAYGVFDLTNGTCTQSGGGSSYSGFSGTTVAVGGGWYRCIVTATTSGNTVFSGVTLTTTGTPTVPDNNFGDPSPTAYLGTGKTLWTWGYQMELGPIASSYIPTTTASVARGGDNLGVLTSSIPYSTTVGTLYTDVVVKDSSTVGVITQFDDGSENNRWNTFYSSNFHGVVIVGGVSQGDTPSGTLSATRNEISFAAQLNNFAISVDGGAIVPDTSGTFPTGITTLRIGIRSDSVVRGGVFRRLVYVPRRVTDGDLPTWRYNF